MNRPRSLRRTLLLGAVLTCALTSVPRDAEASGYLTARFGTDHGTPAHPNAFAIYFNPAALSGTKGTTITGDLSVLLRSARYQRTGDALSPSSDALRSDQQYINANTGVANLTNLLALPYLGVNTDFGTKSWRFGYAAYIPFGGLATWSRRDGDPALPRNQGRRAALAQHQRADPSIYNTFAVAYAFPRYVSIGASFSPVIHHVETVRARNANGSDDTSSNGLLQEGRSYINASGLNFAFSGGIYVEPTSTLRFGLSYISQPGVGETKMSGTLRTQLGPGSESKADIDFLQTYPDVIRLGAAYKPMDNLELRGDFEFVRWSVFESQCVVTKGTSCTVANDGKRIGQDVQLNVPRNWDNAIGLRMGPGYWLNEKTELFGSLGFTTPAVPKETIDASTIDAFRLYATAGIKIGISEHFSFATSYNHIYFFPVDTKGKNDQNLAGHPEPDYNVSRSPSADGKYRSQIGFLNFNAAYTF